jgi:acyl-CoA synthetase (AMP-forming)/AMP-acid ligase II
LAFGLIEAGFTPGDKLVLYCDPTNSAESVVTQMGAIKAGIAVVTFDEKDSAEAFDHALATSKAKGLIFSPSTEAGEDQTRKTFLQSMMPELATMYGGQALNLAKYPNLRHIVQTGHSAMRGVNKFRDLAVYANPAMSTRQIPDNHSDWVTHVVYKNGKEHCTLTSGELVQKVNGLWESPLSAAGSGPVFMACDMENPLGLASFLACSTNFKKVFMPASFNMSQVL